jgi:hypothetical protein
MIGQSETGSILWQVFGVRLCCAFYQPQQTVQKYWAKTILLSQTDMF